jgi:hypothetical protein
VPENRPSVETLITELREAIKQTRRDGTTGWALKVADALASRLEEAERRVATLEAALADTPTGKLVRAVFVNDIAALEAERDLLRDKWRQMEAHGFDSPQAVFARLKMLVAKLDEARRLHDEHCKQGDFYNTKPCAAPWRKP